MQSKSIQSRRHFLLGSGAAAIALSQLTPGIASSSEGDALAQTCRLSAAQNACLKQVDAQQFEGLIGEQFRVQGRLFPQDLQLVEVTSHLRENDPRPSHIRSEAFSLQFMAKNQTLLTAEIHEIYHEKLGSLSMFMSPIGGSTTSGEQRYEVVFG